MMQQEEKVITQSTFNVLFIPSFWSKRTSELLVEPVFLYQIFMEMYRMCTIIDINFVSF